MKKDEEQYDRFVELLRTPLPTLGNPDGFADSIWQAIDARQNDRISGLHRRRWLWLFRLSGMAAAFLFAAWIGSGIRLSGYEGFRVSDCPVVPSRECVVAADTPIEKNGCLQVAWKGREQERRNMLDACRSSVETYNKRR